MSETRQRFRARWVFPVETEPVEDGVVEIECSRIAAVHNRRVADAVNLGDAAIIPGLVNAHTHWEFSDLARPLEPAAPFTHWIESVMEHRRSRTADLVDVIRRGTNESAGHGVTTVGEISTGDFAPETFPTRCVVFRELIGLTPERVQEQLQTAENHLQQEWTERVRPGLSPHAPYSVAWELFEELISLAAQREIPMAVHLAETAAERELLESGEGEFREFLERLGLWQSSLFPGEMRPLNWLQKLANLHRALVIHGNFLDDEELAFLAENPQLTVVYCPRTHAYFGHRPHRWREMVEKGVSLALGTDSRASNPDLSLWRELLFLREQFPAFAPARLLELGTKSGAAALGFDAGTIRVGAEVDLAIVRLTAPTGDAWSQLFHPQNSIEAWPALP